MAADTLAKEKGMSRADYEASTAVKHPMGRNATPQDVAAAVLFLSSQSASFITGDDLALIFRHHATAQHIVAAVLFLSSQSASFITGVVLR